MNLVQIQDRLKGMPMQAVMAYANGQNPEVPPYLALGELNRRKQMEQQAAQPPKASVKDEVEQSLMAKNAMQQGIMGTPKAMQTTGETAEMPSAPQPGGEEEYATGGVVALPVRNEMFDYAGGGIVAFSGDEKKNDKDTGQRVSDDAVYSPEGVLISGGDSTTDSDTTIREVLGLGNRENRKALERAEEEQRIRNAQKAVQAAQTQTSPAATAEAAPAAPVARPSPIPQIPTGGIASNPAGNAAAQYLAQSFKQPSAAIPEYVPLQQEPLGKKWEQYLGKLEQQDAAAQEKFKQQEADRARSSLWKSLIAAGENTRGGGGISALLGGYGKSALAEEEAALARESEQDKLMRERQFNNAKMLSELENLRRAEARGDHKTAYESKLKIRELEQKDNDLKQRAAERIFAESAADRRSAASTAATHGLETQFINDWLKKKENQGKSVSDAIAALKTLGTGQRAESSYASLVEKYADNWAKMDPMERANMKKDGVNNVEDYVKRMLDITKQNKPGGGLPAGVTVTKVGG